MLVQHCINVIQLFCACWGVYSVMPVDSFTFSMTVHSVSYVFVILPLAGTNKMWLHAINIISYEKM